MGVSEDGPFPIGLRHGKAYLLTVKPPSDFYYSDDITYEEKDGEIVLALKSRDENGNEEKIVRIDNSHGTMHIHRFYSDENNTEEVDMDYEEAKEYIYDNWQHFADINEGKK